MKYILKCWSAIFLLNIVVGSPCFSNPSILITYSDSLPYLEQQLHRTLEYLKVGEFDKAQTVLDSCHILIVENGMEGKEIMTTWLLYQGTIDMKKQRPEQAFTLLRKSLKLVDEVVPERDSMAALIWHRIGSVYETQNNFAQAIICHDSAYHRLVRTFGEVHPLIARTLYYKAGDFYRLGDCEGAVP